MTSPEKPREEQPRPVEQESEAGQPAQEWGERHATAEQIASGGKQAKETAPPPESRPGG